MRHLSAVLISAVVAVSLQAAPDQPQFRAGIDLVHLDVSVLDRNRRPVRGLAADDFIVLEDGRPQAVSTFAAVDYADADPPSAPWMRDIASDTRRNDTLDDRRLFVIVMDDGTAQSNLQAVTSAKDAARHFIDRMGPSDLAAVIFTRRNQYAQDYTSDRRRLLAAVDRYTVGFRDMGRVEGGPDTDEFFYRSSVEVLQQVADALIALPQRRKTLVYIGQGVPVDPEAATGIQMIGPDNMMVVGDAAMQQVLLERTQRVLQAAQRANVNIYTIDPCGPRVEPPMQPPGGQYATAAPTCIPGLEQEYLKDLAHATGGRAAVDMNDLTPAIEQIYVENASYYLLGFASSNHRQEGKYRRLEVQVRRDNVEVRARSGYTERHAERERRAADKDTSSPLAKAISGLLPKGDVPLQVWAAPYAISGRSDSRIALTLGVRQTTGERLAPLRESVDVTIDAYSVAGRRVSGQTVNAGVVLKPGPAGTVAYEVLSSVTLPPGRYQIRVGAFLRSTRATGSVYYDLDVPEFSKQDITMSGLALASSPGVISASTDATPWLPLSPTTSRLFARADRVQAFVRVYQRGRVARAVVPVRARMVDATGREVWTVTDDIAPTTFVNGAAHVTREVPTSSLTPGAHLLVLEALSPDRSLVVATREVRFTVR